MKKVSFLFLALAVIMAACTSKTEKKEFALTGKLPSSEYDGKQVYLQIIDENTGDFVSVDTATIANSTFAFGGLALDTPAIRFISMDALRYPAVFVLESDSIEMSFDTVYAATIKGSELNDKYQAFADKRNSIYQGMVALDKEEKAAKEAKKLTPELEAILESRYDSIYSEANKATFDFTKSNLSNVVGQYVLMDRGVSFSAEQLKELLPALDAKLKTNAKIQKIEKRLEALEATEVGKQFVDIKGTTPTGETIALSDYAGKGKYVLIDFWASWCPPCRKEMPIVVEAYNKYKSKGFEIVGVSLDNDKAAWEKGIKDLKITWPQMSDLKGWKTDLGAAYAVNSIPHTVLLDKDGKIIEKNLRGDQLLKKLAELLK
ncbi:TlpA disulfide reductase family protein [Dysgonomonas macrotermitis]|uniref:Peroxiredoxin n=1 Tax=Dysgonomonas macrotermitis TaxID=1346286 RepID=A0A1M4U9U3_9BACT|nr:TlpA disulfide reductase family protein [Dysgonomonas macrotermitis]SHE53611.1 Peroxiredoxin [Dysgonomonas macrotermitis]